MNAEDIVARLGLEAHPEGGHFVETWRHTTDDGSRGAGTAIYYLLREGERSAWHRVDATEIWHFYAGSPLELRIEKTAHVLGPNFSAGQQPQIIVPARAWQSARSLGAWTLVGCTVSPAFEFDGFELAPEGFEP